jgi:hypothetical protein
MRFGFCAIIAAEQNLLEDYRAEKRKGDGE